MVRNSSGLKVLRTQPLTNNDSLDKPTVSWALRLDSIKIGVDSETPDSMKKFFDSNDRNVRLEPSLPYIYAPEKDWEEIISIFRAAS
jgi:hypothetical protein